MKKVIKTLETKVKETNSALHSGQKGKPDETAPVKGKASDDKDAEDKDEDGDDKVDEDKVEDEKPAAVVGGSQQTDK